MNQINIAISSWSRTEKILLASFAAGAFALLAVLSAEIRIPVPFTPVPMTLQTFIVPLAGGFLGGIWGLVSMLVYLALGIFGFSGAFAAASGGLAFFVSPTIGYLLSYPLVAFLVGQARDARKSILLLTLIATNALTFTCGMLGLMLNAHMTLGEAFARGVAPFWIGDILKITTSFLVLLSYRFFRK